MLRVIWQLLLIWASVVFAYIVIAILNPFFVEVTNATITEQIAAGTNLANYPGSEAAVRGFPFWVFLLPGLIGTGWSVLILRENSKQN